MKLDLGSGTNTKPGFNGVDLYEDADICWDLVSGATWPWVNVKELYSSHFIEHIPADFIRQPNGKTKDRLFWFFDEAFRVIVPGGKFTIIWPALKSSNAFRDPTHRRFLPLEFTHYLSKEGRRAMGVSQYNVDCNWVVEHTRLFTVSGEWKAAEIASLWDVQDSYEVVMRAEK